MDIVEGTKLTVNCEIIGESGQILFNEGDIVEVSEVVKHPGFWGKNSGYYHEEVITGVKLLGRYGIWFLSAFKETK